MTEQERKEKISARMKEYQKTHAKEISAYQKAYRKAHPEKVRQWRENAVVAMYNRIKEKHTEI